MHHSLMQHVAFLTVCTPNPSLHYLLITSKNIFCSTKYWVHWGSDLGSVLTWSIHTPPRAFDHHLCLTAPMPLHWIQRCLLSSRSIFNCPLSIPKWISHESPNCIHAKLILVFFLWICFFTGVPNSIFGSTVLPMSSQKLWWYFWHFFFSK